MGKTTNLNWLARFFLNHQQYHPSPITLHEEIPKNSGETAARMICWDSELRYRNSRNPSTPQVPLNKDPSTSYKRNLLPTEISQKHPKKTSYQVFPFWKNLLLLRWFQTIFTRRWTYFPEPPWNWLQPIESSTHPRNSPGGPMSFVGKGRNNQKLSRGVLIETGDVFLFLFFCR